MKLKFHLWKEKRKKEKGVIKSKSRTVDDHDSNLGTGLHIFILLIICGIKKKKSGSTKAHLALRWHLDETKCYQCAVLSDRHMWTHPELWRKVRANNQPLVWRNKPTLTEVKWLVLNNIDLLRLPARFFSFVDTHFWKQCSDSAVTEMQWHLLH